MHKAAYLLFTVFAAAAARAVNFIAAALHSIKQLVFCLQFMLLLLVLLLSESVTTILLLVYQPSLLWRIRVIITNAQ